MSTELIERLAREADIAYEPDWRPGELHCNFREDVNIAPHLARFAALVAEQCARKVELSASAEQAASAIRAAFPMPKD